MLQPAGKEALTWTNQSVLSLAGDKDPVEAVTQKGRTLILDAIDHGWSGPPFDPFELADYPDIRIPPRHEVRDARMVVSGDDICIQYNPNRPKGRVRFSVAHEIAHTLFPDYQGKVHHRIPLVRATDDEWQLEALCN